MIGHLGGEEVVEREAAPRVVAEHPVDERIVVQRLTQHGGDPGGLVGAGGPQGDLAVVHICARTPACSSGAPRRYCQPPRIAPMITTASAEYPALIR